MKYNDTKGGAAMLFRKKVERYCTYCVFAGKLDDETMICKKCGVVPATHRCRRFRYDPLMRIPARQPVLGQYTEEDFRL